VPVIGARLDGVQSEPLLRMLRADTLAEAHGVTIGAGADLPAAGGTADVGGDAQTLEQQMHVAGLPVGAGGEERPLPADMAVAVEQPAQEGGDQRLRQTGDRIPVPLLRAIRQADAQPVEQPPQQGVPCRGDSYHPPGFDAERAGLADLRRHGALTRRDAEQTGDDGPEAPDERRLGVGELDENAAAPIFPAPAHAAVSRDQPGGIEDVLVEREPGERGSGLEAGDLRSGSVPGLAQQLQDAADFRQGEPLP